MQDRYKDGEVKVLGPAEMPLAKVRGKHRHHVLLKIRRGLKCKPLIDYILQDFESRKPVGIQCQVDVDPVSLL